MGRLSNRDRVGTRKGIFQALLQAVLQGLLALFSSFAVLVLAIAGHGVMARVLRFTGINVRAAGPVPPGPRFMPIVV